MIAWGLVAWLRGGVSGSGDAASGGGAARPSSRSPCFLVLRAFASGCVALTGIEAVSDGVPAFRPPEARNARQVLVMLGTILVAFFVGITFLTHAFGLTPAAAGDGELPAGASRLRGTERPAITSCRP